MQVDIEATRTPSFLMVRPMTVEGDAWISDNVESEAIWRGDTLLCEHRYGPDLLFSAHNDGLTVSIDGRVADAPREGV